MSDPSRLPSSSEQWPFAITARHPSKDAATLAPISGATTALRSTANKIRRMTSILRRRKPLLTQGEDGSEVYTDPQGGSAAFDMMTPTLAESPTLDSNGGRAEANDTLVGGTQQLSRAGDQATRADARFFLGDTHAHDNRGAVKPAGGHQASSQLKRAVVVAPRPSASSLKSTNAPVEENTPDLPQRNHLLLDVPDTRACSHSHEDSRFACQFCVEQRNRRIGYECVD